MGNRRKTRVGLLSVGVFVAMSAAGRAVAADSHPDFSGVYQARPAYFPGTANIKTTDGSPIPELPAEAVKRKLLDDRVKSNKPVIRNVQMVWPKGFVQASRARFYFDVVQIPKQISFFFEEDSQYFMAYLDEQHPANVKPSFFGDSVAHWEGDTLVIDTVGFNGETPIDTIQVSDKLHTVMRLRLIENGKALENVITFDDPENFAHPWRMTLVYDRQKPDLKLYESVYAEDNRDLPDLSDR